MYEYNTTPTPQPPEKKKTGAGIKVVCVLLALALVGSFAFFYSEISSLRTQLSQPGETASADSTEAYEASVASLESQVKTLSAQLASATDRLNNLSYSSSDGTVVASQSLVSVAATVKKSVVGIRVTIPSMKVQSGFFTYTTQEASVEGTGVIISEDGYIITNEHVIADVKEYDNAYIDVIMNDGTEYSAELIGSDSANDLAVVKITAEGLTPIAVGTSSDLLVGETVLAVGNPLGTSFAGSVTMGIVSALDRQVSQENTSENMIQHDAAINPGNSGGALVNAYGELVGINTSKISSTEVEGLGFAIPIDYAFPIVNEIIEYGYVRGRVTLGFSGQELSERSAGYYGVPAGLMVTQVTEDSGADLAGIKVYDIITAFDGKEIMSMEDIEAVKAEHKVGDIVEITWYRNGSYSTANIIFMEDTQG